MASIGIDFGTTNSSLVAYDGTQFTHFHWDGPIPKPIPSVVWYHDNRVVVGDEAKQNFNRFCDEHGHHIEKSIKSKLGTDRTIAILGKPTQPYEVAAEIIRALKREAEKDDNAAGVELHHAVFTVPVKFSGRQRNDLRKAAQAAGIDVRTFIHEPFAAIIGYMYNNRKCESNSKYDGKCFLVFDWGGGTLDITVVKSDGTKLFEIGTSELTGIAGDQFDNDLANMCRERFKEQYLTRFESEFGRDKSKDFLEEKLNAKRDKIIAAAEKCKIELSTKIDEEFNVAIFNWENSDGKREYFDIDERITRKSFEKCIERHVETAISRIDSALRAANVDEAQVELVLMTGGSSKIPVVVDKMRERFGYRVETIGNSDTVIAEGAAVVSQKGWTPFLSKNIMVELSDGTFWIAFESDTPIVGDYNLSLTEQFTCVDVRDADAKLIIAEGYKRQIKDKNLDVLRVPLEPTSLPPKWLAQSSIENFVRSSIEDIEIHNQRVLRGTLDDIEVTFTIDQNIILSVSGHSIYKGHRRTVQIDDLCFGIDMR